MKINLDASQSASAHSSHSSQHNENIYFLKNEDFLISIEFFNMKENQIFSMNQLNLNSNVVLERIDAKNASWIEENKYFLYRYFFSLLSK